MESNLMVYWEKQDSDLMCAVHSLNSLLQYPFFDPVSLAEIGRDIDAEERHLLEAAHSRSENVAESGNYSSQVISRALSSHNLTLDYFGPNKDPLQEVAFICNFQSHWITLRNLYGDWYDLNSIAELPKWVGELYLSELLLELRNQGYTIFVITGKFPVISFYEDLQSHQMLIPVKRIKNQHRVASDDKDLREAIERSMNENIVEQDFELEKAIADSLGIAEDDEELRLAIELSKGIEKHGDVDIAEECSGPNSFVIRLKCLDGKIASRKFNPDSVILQVFLWARSLSTYPNFRLIQSFPRIIFEDMAAKLNEVGINPVNNLIIIEKA